MSSNIFNLYVLLGAQKAFAELLSEESRAPKCRPSIVDTIILKARASLQQQVTSADGPALGNNGLPLSIKDLSKGCDNLVFLLVFMEDGDAAQHRLILRKPLHADEQVAHEKEDPLPINMHTPSVQAFVTSIVKSVPFAAGQKSPEFTTPSVLYLHEAGGRGDESFVIETFVGGHDLDTVYPPPNFKNCLRERGGEDVPATDVSSTSHVGCDGRRAYPSAYYALWSDVAGKLAVLHKATKTTDSTSSSQHACSATAAPSHLGGAARPHCFVPKSSFGFGEFNARLSVNRSEDGEHRGIVEGDQYAKCSEGEAIDFSTPYPTDYPRYYQCASKTWHAAIIEGGAERKVMTKKTQSSTPPLTLSLRTAICPKNYFKRPSYLSKAKRQRQQRMLRTFATRSPLSPRRKHLSMPSTITSRLFCGPLPSRR